jgi:hypothetical protein
MLDMRRELLLLGRRNGRDCTETRTIFFGGKARKPATKEGGSNHPIISAPEKLSDSSSEKMRSFWIEGKTQLTVSALYPFFPFWKNEIENMSVAFIPLQILLVSIDLLVGWY